MTPSTPTPTTNKTKTQTKTTTTTQTIPSNPRLSSHHAPLTSLFSDINAWATQWANPTFTPSPTLTTTLRAFLPNGSLTRCSSAILHHRPTTTLLLSAIVAKILTRHCLCESFLFHSGHDAGRVLDGWFAAQATLEDKTRFLEAQAEEFELVAGKDGFATWRREACEVLARETARKVRPLMRVWPDTLAFEPGTRQFCITLEEIFMKGFEIGFGMKAGRDERYDVRWVRDSVTFVPEEMVDVVPGAYKDAPLREPESFRVRWCVAPVVIRGSIVEEELEGGSRQRVWKEDVLCKAKVFLFK
ncbi:hypothetical protein BU24DRAFT_472151 [Aaosphaeria arxii CBS 175.79]|uniref:Uncharacterized protein n=1 Tax=Aaosphaeria arxii CBS 175.79 TaxID=1450172 RepID=A0A6A5XDF5_9PLEO|nr:uncharacterized protein BU24DRAFT_472151 [Aaosphaeria arxii CBS 175.79]KAF2011028.1 hypothetical protein BU24DRAFT_472151 [Aaosphaeria arxii CBS 175.79]